MSTFLFVHGGWHGGWCWQRVAQRLAAAGHRVLTPDLPGHGADPTPVSARPWERYVPSLLDIVETQREPVILVGHSSGGMLISEVARRQPDKVAALVYLAAFLLPRGANPGDVMDEGSGSLLTEALTIDLEAGTTTVRPAMVREVFYHDCPTDVAAWAASQLRPEPVIPRGAAPRDEGASADIAVPRVYLETTQDRALPIAMQRRMEAAMPCDAVFTLETSHSPFLSQPERLADILVRIDENIAQSKRPSPGFHRWNTFRDRCGKS
jgi:pimeloyl-ACP methyl ester carboxylesterase